MHDSFSPPISTSNLFEPDFDKVCAILDEASDRIGSIPAGSLVVRLEDKLRDYHNAKYCVAFSTGFWALVAAARIRAISDRSTVIIPALTYRRLADVVFWSGKVPSFVDVDPESLAISRQAVEDAISNDTALILAVHPIVNCCDVHGLLAVAERHQIPIIFDAVESVHETVGGQRVGSFGVGEVFSLHASKLINGIEGGYVCTDDKTLARQLREFRSCGGPGSGLNAILNDGHAAFAIASLDGIDRNIGHNEIVYRRYLRQLRSVRGINVLPFSEHERTSYKNVVAEVADDFPVSRDELVVLLNARGILARAHYAPSLDRKKYAYRVVTRPLPVTRQASVRFINLPCGQRVTQRDVDSVCGFLKSLSDSAMQVRTLCE